MRAVVLTLVLLALATQPAAAATVSQEFFEAGKVSDASIFVKYSAGPGETNRLTVEATATETRFRDVVPIVAGAGCEAIAEGDVVCRSEPRSTFERSVLADLGGGDDTADLQGAASVLGGGGEDRLTGGDGPQWLSGGTGRDAVDGGPGDDFLSADVAGPGELPDQLAGGEGRDRLDFGGLRSSAEVDLAVGRARVGAKAYELTGFEAVVGTRFDDRISGGPGSERLSGSDGADVLDGRGGDDELVGGSDRDVVRGGAGDDRLEDQSDVSPYASEDPEGGNRYECGPGRDDLLVVASVDEVGASCEIIGDSQVLADLRQRAPAHLQLALDRCYEGDKCRARLTLRTARRTLLVRRTFRISRAADRTAVVRLGPAARRILRLEGSTRVLVDLGVRFELHLER